MPALPLELRWRPGRPAAAEEEHHRRPLPAGARFSLRLENPGVQPGAVRLFILLHARTLHGGRILKLRSLPVLRLCGEGQREGDESGEKPGEHGTWISRALPA